MTAVDVKAEKWICGGWCFKLSFRMTVMLQTTPASGVISSTTTESSPPGTVNGIPWWVILLMCLGFLLLILLIILLLFILFCWRRSVRFLLSCLTNLHSRTTVTEHSERRCSCTTILTPWPTHTGMISLESRFWKLLVSEVKMDELKSLINTISKQWHRPAIAAKMLLSFQTDSDSWHWKLLNKHRQASRRICSRAAKP